MARILIVEDEEKIARFVTLELEHEGYQVEHAADGRTAVDLALERNYDLIPVSYTHLDVYKRQASYRGRRIVKRLPTPSTEVTPMTPPWLSTIHLAMASPRPEPCAPASRALSAR